MRHNPTRVITALALAAFTAFLPSGPARAWPVPGQGTWEATLLPRDINGDGSPDAFYDTVLDLTWLADADAGAGSVYDSTRYSSATDGRMNWVNASAWAASLDVFGVTGWRLPRTLDTGRPGCDWSNAGGTDCGYNVQTVSADGRTVYSEMAHLYYVTLGNLGRCTPGLAVCTPQPGWMLVNSGAFEDLDAFVYWSGSTVANPSPAAWSFDFRDGVQDGHTQPLEFQAWAVRSGDVPNRVSEPPAMALLLLALGAAALTARRRQV